MNVFGMSHPLCQSHIANGEIVIDQAVLDLVWAGAITLQLPILSSALEEKPHGAGVLGE